MVNNDSIKVYFKKLYSDSQLPFRKNEEDAGFDCFVHHFCKWDKICIVNIITDNKLYTINPHQTIGCALGFASEIPNGYYAHVLPRSGLALKEDLIVTIGTIDSGYRNEWIAILHNLGETPKIIHVGDKICQMIIRKSENIIIEEKTELSPSIRGLNGFGSSGK